MAFTIMWLHSGAIRFKLSSVRLDGHKKMDQKTILIIVAVVVVLGILMFAMQTPSMHSTAPPAATPTPPTSPLAP